ASQETCRDDLNVHGRGVRAVACMHRPAPGCRRFCSALLCPVELQYTRITGPLMSLSQHHAETSSAPIIQLRPDSLAAVASEPAMQIIRRNGKVTPFDSAKIAVAMTKAFLAVEGNTAVASRRVHEIVEQLTADVVAALARRASEGRTFHIE